MATTGRQSQFHRILPTVLPGLLIALLGFALPVEALPPVPPSGYEIAAGEPFFLLSDASFGSADQATVRLEVSDSGLQEAERLAGVDIDVYRVPDPLALLHKQKNLHRIDVRGKPAPEGLANTLGYLFDSWYKEARRSWQRVLSTPARKRATDVAPQFSMGEAMSQPTQFEHAPKFRPLPGYDLVARFRYPVALAKPIAPPPRTQLEGSSSDFIPTANGNVMVPLGRLAPGLYLVEASLGMHRANTLVFVSDTVAFSKVAADQLLVWTAGRVDGKPAAHVRCQWTDGVGVLKSGETSDEGVLDLERASPEHTYVYGVDPAGGVFISENYYYDSEIYDTKLYAVTDRPLYRPGDEVAVKIFAREFKNARTSVPLAATTMMLTALDPAGTPVASRTIAFDPQSGGEARFRLPENATAGGYELRIGRGDDRYAAAFRVAEYVKPHFDVHVVLDRPDHKTGQPIRGRLELRYPDGRPVAGAHVTLQVRAQQTSMVEGQLRYSGLFPIKLEQQELTSDVHGNAALDLPAATEPSRYVLTVLANDDAAWRVRVTRELLIERGVTAYAIERERRFTQPDETVQFELKAQGSGGGVPARWEALRLETRSTTGGSIAAGAGRFSIKFGEAGSYTVKVRDAAGNLLGAIGHWVAGPGLKSAPGRIEIVFDRAQYRAGETAEALVTFPEPVDDALLTLERERVQHHAMLHGARWVETTRVGPTQWRARIKVAEEHAPNMTFSVLYVRQGNYVFENAGIKVAQPSVSVRIATDKAVYAPGDTVTVDLHTEVAGRPVAADVAAGVVDELIYVLQPEIAPDILDFFYHPRRDNVRTFTSLAFIGYDLATSYAKTAPAAGGNASERAAKVLERPRRDEIDTAAWQPSLRTDATGHARFTFVVPDSLTRWRITARAMTAGGLVGQSLAHLRSEKSFYLRWTGPTRYRKGDRPEMTLVAFNQTEREQSIDLVVGSSGTDQIVPLVLKRGANYVALPLNAANDGDIVTTLRLQGKDVDRLATRISTVATQWPSPRLQQVRIEGSEAALALPADAGDLTVTLSDGVDAHFLRVVDDLIAYPFGCIEQTSSRLIPLALAQRVLAGGPAAEELEHLLYTQRLRLVRLAGNDGVFGWWGRGSRSDLFLSAYAYYADWYAARALDLKLPEERWQRLLDLYAKEGGELPLSQRALVLWWLRQAGVPVGTLLAGLDEALAATAKPVAEVAGPHDGLLIALPDSALGRATAVVLDAQLHRETKSTVPEPVARQLASANEALAQGSFFSRSLLVFTGQVPANPAAAELLAQVSPESPTLERAMALVWLREAGIAKAAGAGTPLRPTDGWQPTTRIAGSTQWRWTGGRLPASLKLAAAAPAGTVAALRYTSTTAEKHLLPARVERRLLRLEPGGEALHFKAVALKADEEIRADALYIDEVTIESSGQDLRHALLEVPLPPGAGIEGTTWGLDIEGLDAASASKPGKGADNRRPGAPGQTAGNGNGTPAARQATEGFVSPQYESGELVYRIPLDTVSGSVVVRELVRFSQRGRFTVPSARLQRMYQPDRKAFERTATRTLVVR